MKAWQRWPTVSVNPCGNVSIYAGLAREFLDGGHTIAGLGALLVAVETFRDELREALAHV